MATTTGTIQERGKNASGERTDISQTVTGGAKHVRLSDASANLYTALTTWIFGDPSAGATIAASGNSGASAAVDVRAVDKDHATVVVVVTGDGTCKLNIKGSRDGATDLYDMGDRIAAMTVGTYVLKMDDSNLSYAHYLTFLVTETGTTDGVVVKVFLMGRGIK